MRPAHVASSLLLFFGSISLASCSFADLSSSLSDNGDLDSFFSDPTSSELEPLDFTSVVNPPPPLTEEIFSDSYDSTISDFLASDPDPSSQCSGFFPLPLNSRIGARSDFCSPDPIQDPSSNDGVQAQPAGQILSAEDLENYWCSGTPRKLNLANIPVCELALYADSSLPELLTEEGFAEVIFGNLSLLSLFLLSHYRFQILALAMSSAQGKQNSLS